MFGLYLAGQAFLEREGLFAWWRLENRTRRLSEAGFACTSGSLGLLKATGLYIAMLLLKGKLVFVLTLYESYEGCFWQEVESPVVQSKELFMCVCLLSIADIWKSDVGRVGGSPSQVGLTQAPSVCSSPS